MRTLALINARGQSKGVPRKNILPLDGIPLIAWSIHTAKVTRGLSSIVVSTDDDEIATVARKYGARVPFMRPAHLATDRSRQFDTIKHTLLKLKDAGESYDAVAVLQPTCPLRSHVDVENCLDTMNSIDADTIITVRSAYGGILNTLYHRQADGTSVSLSNSGSEQGMIRQTYKQTYQRTGGVYLIKTRTILDDNVLYGRKLGSVIMPPERCFDVDDPFDWSLLETWVLHNDIKREHFK